MPSSRISQNTLASFHAIAGKDTIYWDTELRGFAVKVTGSGLRSYIVQTRIKIGLNKRRVRLGSCDRMTAKEAREVARKQLANMGLGHDPITERKAVEMASLTLSKALEDRLTVKRLKLAVARDYRAIASRVFADWMDKPLSTITDQMAVDRHRQVTLKSGPSYANYALRVLSATFSHARGMHGLKAPNPVTRLREGKLFNKTRPRDEFVEPHHLPQLLLTLRQMELARIALDKAAQDAARDAGQGLAGWHGRQAQKPYRRAPEDRAPTLGYAGSGDIVRTLLLTGFRLEECQGLEWDSVDLERKVITLTDNKASRTLRMPMCEALVSLMSRRRSQMSGRWVFPTAGAGRYQNLPKIDMPALSREVSKALGQDFHIHAHKLRHTFATYLRAMGHSEWTVAALLNHSRQSSVTTIYAAPMTGTMHGVVNEYQGYLERLISVPSIHGRGAEMLCGANQATEHATNGSKQPEDCLFRP